MTRARIVFAAMLVGSALAAGTALAQAAQAPHFTPILSGKQFTPRLKGAANVEFTNPSTKRDKDNVVTKIDVKNTSDGPIARLTIDEIWYDKGGQVIAGGKGVINGVLQPGEVMTVT